jgi:hypothetical protein
MVLLWGPTGRRFLISEATLYASDCGNGPLSAVHFHTISGLGVQGYLAHKNTSLPKNLK